MDRFLWQGVVGVFATSGCLGVVTPVEADAILEGEVVGYEIQALAFDPRASIRQYRLAVTMNLTFPHVRRNPLLFEPARFRGKAGSPGLAPAPPTTPPERPPPPPPPLYPP